MVINSEEKEREKQKRENDSLLKERHMVACGNMVCIEISRRSTKIM